MFAISLGAVLWYILATGIGDNRSASMRKSGFGKGEDMFTDA